MSEAMKTRQIAQRPSSAWGQERYAIAGPSIHRIHSLVLKDRAGLFGFGERCLEVKGEP